MASDEFDPYQQWLGIPPTVRPIDYYTLLGVERFCDDRQRIEQAAEQRMRLLRTYQTGPRGVYTQKLLNEITQARLRLLDAKKKAEYDERLRRSVQAAAELAVADETLSLPPGAPAALWPFGFGPTAPAAVAAPVPGTAPPPGALLSTAPAAAQGAPPGGWLPTPSVSRAPGSGPAAVTGGQAGAKPPVVVPSRSLQRGGRRRARRVPWSNYLWLASVSVLTVIVFAGSWVLWRNGYFRRGWPSQQDTTQNLNSNTSHSMAGEAIVPDGTGRIRLLAEQATILKRKSARRPNDHQPRLDQWDPEQLEWSFLASKSSQYEAQLTYQVRGNPAGAKWVMRLDGGPPSSWDLSSSGQDDQLQVTTTTIYVRGAGLHRLSLGLQNLPAGVQVVFHSLELRPNK